MRFIVNADDAGLHPSVGRAVEILSEKGVVTSASLVANGMDVENAVTLRNVSLGVHLDILRGRPLTHWQNVNSLVDENGAFLVDPVKLFKRYALGKVDHTQVEMEWRAQIERIIDLGVKPTHLTSHKHVHGWPSLTRMAADLSKHYNIKWLRKPEECSEISKLDKSGLQSKFQNVCGYFDRETDDVNWTDCYWDAAENEDELTTHAFYEFIQRCSCGKDGVVELCCKPGITIAGDPPIPEYCNPPKISAVWRSEFGALSELAWLDTFADLHLSLTDFGSLYT